MGLHAYTVYLCAVLLDELDDPLGTGRLGSCGVDVVVVVVELGARICGSGGSEGDGDVCFADGVEEDIGAVGAIFVEGFVDNIPVDTFTLVVCDFLSDVVLQDTDKSGIVETTV